MAHKPTKNELYERATELDIYGRSEMSKRELAEAIDDVERSLAFYDSPDEPEVIVDLSGETRQKEDALYALRVEAREADKRVADAQRKLNRARAYHGDFTVRDENTRKAAAELQEARLDAFEAWSAFDTAKKEAARR